MAVTFEKLCELRHEPYVDMWHLYWRDTYEPRIELLRVEGFGRDHVYYTPQRDGKSIVGHPVHMANMSNVFIVLTEVEEAIQAHWKEVLRNLIDEAQSQIVPE